MPNFITKWKRPESFSLDCDDGDCVERAGYIPVKAQVERLRAAGMRLAIHRDAQYDGDDPEGLEIDPSRTMDEFEQHDYFGAVDQYLREKYRKAQERRQNVKTQGEATKVANEVPSESNKEIIANE